MGRGLVLGGGGIVGMGYLAGALKALEEWGLDPGGADVLVGTSAGAVLGAYLAAGWTGSDFYEYAHGRHPQSERTDHEQTEAVKGLFVPLWTSPSERIRRGIGSLFSVVSARGYYRAGVRGGVPPSALRRAFPSGLYSTDGTRVRLHEDLPAEWPRDDLYICAADLYTGRRVAFGAEGAPRASLPDAVLASTAIPGIFPPVRIDDRHYVDGGIVTATSLDLAVDAGCETVVCVAPLGYRNEGRFPLSDPTMWRPMFVRGLFARSLSREVKDARARGVHVAVVRPWLEELKKHGTNAMRHFDRIAVAEAGREGTLRFLEKNAGHPAVAATNRKESPA